MKKSQQVRILECLRNPENKDKDGWVGLPVILDLHVSQYGSRIKELRRGNTLNKKVYNIENKTEWINGERHSWFRLVNDVPEQVSFGFVGGNR